jgi:hypothetical protein
LVVQLTPQGCFGHAGVRGNGTADKLARDGSFQRFVGHEPSLGVSRQNIRRKIKRWLDNLHLARWRGLCGNQRQAQELISDPSPGPKTRLLSFNRTQSSVVTGPLAGPNTLRSKSSLNGANQ